MHDVRKRMDSEFDAVASRKFLVGQILCPPGGAGAVAVTVTRQWLGRGCPAQVSLHKMRLERRPNVSIRRDQWREETDLALALRGPKNP